jgi:predicted enzyme related to lactoylglutathione lyase
MNRAFTNILCENPEATAAFYQSLLGLTRLGDFGWFILLGSPDMPQFELGILDFRHETVPAGLIPGGASAMLTFVVDDLQGVVERAAAIGAVVVQEPTDMPYGQTRLLLRDPAGTLVDVSALTA